MRTILCSAAILFAIALSSFSQSSVWKISSSNSIVYIGGTCHVLRETDFPLPKEFDTAYARSARLVFETDIKQMSDPQFQIRLMQAGTYTDGQTLEQNLKPVTVAAVKAHCEKIGIPFAALNRMKPAMVMMMLTMTELQKHGVTRKGADFFFSEKAHRDKKPTISLETPEEQIRMLASLGQENPDELLTYTLQDMDRVGEIIGTIITAWKTGDQKKLNELFVDELKKEHPRLYKDLLSDRNHRWVVKVREFFKTDETELILVGAGHLVGDDGLLSRLTKEGFKVEQVGKPALR